MNFSKSRKDHGEDDFSFDIDVQETVDFEIDTSEDDYERSRYRERESFSYWKFFIGLFFVGLSVFAIINMYNRYEERKEMEAVIKELDKWNQELDGDFQQMMDSVSTSPGPEMERDVQRTMDSFSALPWPEPRAEPEYRYVDEFYQDPDGTWKNRKRKVEVKR